VFFSCSKPVTRVFRQKNRRRVNHQELVDGNVRVNIRDYERIIALILPIILETGVELIEKVVL